MLWCTLYMHTLTTHMYSQHTCTYMHTRAYTHCNTCTHHMPMYVYQCTVHVTTHHMHITCTTHAAPPMEASKKRTTSLRGTKNPVLHCIYVRTSYRMCVLVHTYIHTYILATTHRKLIVIVMQHFLHNKHFLHDLCMSD